MRFPRATRLLVLSPTRWRLRKAVEAVNEVLGSLGLLKHPDKTFNGRTERGFPVQTVTPLSGRAARRAPRKPVQRQPCGVR